MMTRFVAVKDERVVPPTVHLYEADGFERVHTLYFGTGLGWKRAKKIAAALELAAGWAR